MGAQELVQAARGRLIGKVWMGKPENPNEADEKSPGITIFLAVNSHKP